jgi:hypothetical protein
METTTDARAAVLRQLEAAFERHAIDEQLTRTTDPETAEMFHRFGVRVLRARLTEEENPPSPEPVIHCLNCAAAYARGSK